MRRLVQLGALLTLVMSGVMLAGSFTAADASGTTSTKPAVLQAAWFWQTAYEQANPPVAAGPAPANEPSGVPKGDLAVAHTSSDGSSSKMALLAFDIGTLTSGSIIDSFTFSVTLDTGPSAVNTGVAGAPVVACIPTRLWPASMGGDYTDEPSVDCSTKVVPKVNGNTYTFDIPSIAQQWVDDQNLGVALVNDPDNTQTPFQLAFTGAKTVKAKMTATTGTSVPAATTPPVGSFGGTTSGAGSSASSSGGLPAPAGNVPPPPNTSMSTTGDTGQAPQVAPSAASPKLAQVASVSAASSAPGRGFWIGAAAFALLILLMSLVLGDQPQAVASNGGSRLDRVLRGGPADNSALANRS